MTIATDHIASDAPIDYGVGRRCTMGVRCETYRQTAWSGNAQVGKVSRYTEAHQEPGNGASLILLCEPCNRAFLKSGLEVHKFVGTQKKGRIYSYPLPKLNEVRNEKGWTRRELARRAKKCSHETIGSIEDNGANASHQMAGRLAGALGVEIGKLKGA